MTPTNRATLKTTAGVIAPFCKVLRVNRNVLDSCTHPPLFAPSPRDSVHLTFFTSVART